MFTAQQYVKASSLEEAYALNQKKSSAVLGGGCWMKMGKRRIGALIEQPVAYDRMTARQNLMLERILSRSTNEKDVDGLLKVLHISPDEVGRAAIRNYSVGMRQRYGVAAALLGEPEFLVLDEPASGLDPAGTRDLRELLLSCNREKGTTMLISSHILSELYQLATDFIILHRGRILRKITHAQLEQESEGFESIDEYFLNLIEQAETRR